MDRRLSSSSVSSSSTIRDEKEYSNDLYHHPTPQGRSRYERARALILACSALTMLSLSAMLVYALWSTQIQTRIVDTQWLPIPSIARVDEEPAPVIAPVLRLPNSMDPLSVLQGPPTQSFRDNLRDDTQYVTSWVSAGWTNDVMTYANLIYLGILTSRVPVVGDFIPSHLGGVAPIPFSEVFDMPRLRRLLGVPVLEWREIKDPESLHVETLGCWGVWQSVQKEDPEPRSSHSQDYTRLDVSITKTPEWVKMIPHYEHDKSSTFWSLASLAFPEERAKSLTTPQPSSFSQVQIPPDEHMLCYDYLYYAVATKPSEYDHDYSPAWRSVAQHMHWAPKLQETANFYIRHALGVSYLEPIPPFISIHMRHADFAQYCGDVSLLDCYPSIAVIARRVEEVRKKLLEKKGMDVKHVMMTSDERNSTWWDEVHEQGWFSVDHSHTAELHGAWYPVLIDAVIQSSGHGFVGTDLSTMSTLARRRVESWQGGVSRTVKWGTPTSDDH